MGWHKPWSPRRWGAASQYGDHALKSAVRSGDASPGFAPSKLLHEKLRHRATYRQKVDTHQPALAGNSGRPIEGSLSARAAIALTGSRLAALIHRRRRLGQAEDGEFVACASTLCRDTRHGGGRNRGNEFGPSHSITSSARASSSDRSSMPSPFAVFRFTVIVNFVACSTGRSAGFPPLSILSTNVAAYRQRSTNRFRTLPSLQPARIQGNHMKRAGTSGQASRWPQNCR
jgi:hypothetical protein